MREIYRTIVGAIIFSKDNKLLMGKKDPKDGGVYNDCWHLPGGGVETGESLEEAVIREIQEEVELDISDCELVPLPYPGTGSSEKTLKETGEIVLCHMEFNRFQINIGQNADDIILNLCDDLIEIKWFDKAELSDAKQIPGGKEFFQQMGYL